MYTIDNIALENYGLYVSTHTGQIHLPEVKDQLFTVYNKEGYQITKRKANTLELNGFIIAADLPDFIAKTTVLQNLFAAEGVREIVLNNGVINCFAKDGFTVLNVQIVGEVYAKIQLKLTIV